MSQSLPSLIPCFLAFMFLGIGWGAADEVNEQADQQVRQALERLNPLIGEWRGTGQERRGSNRGAWRQSGAFRWDFSGKTPAIAYLVEDGKLVQSGRMTWTESDRYELQVTTTDNGTRVYRGDWDGAKLILLSAPDAEGVSYRLTLNALNDKRSLVLHEKTGAGGKSFFRVAEVGYTRAGTRLALPGGGRRECVVTGGTAETAVQYKGETYYVCCTGCRQAFEDDPEGIIEDFKARLEARLKAAPN